MKSIKVNTPLNKAKPLKHKGYSLISPSEGGKVRASDGSIYGRYKGGLRKLT